MKILVAPDSFKNCLSAADVGKYLREGILREMPDAELKIIPLADGGEGTVNALLHALGGERIRVRVHDPLMRAIWAEYGILSDGNTAVIEMAAASGLELLGGDELDPMHTTTYGTGELIKSALERSCTKIILGLGGSATIDGGMGALEALGAGFRDKNGAPLSRGGGSLVELEEIDVEGLDNRLKDCSILLASDVDNPLCGLDGAARVYGPQKGAEPPDVEKLDKGLERFARLVKKFKGRDIGSLPGAGAAGGLGAGLLAFTGAEFRNGFELISQMCRLEDAIAASDLIITGEGRMDAQTAHGKTPYGVAKIAARYNKPLIAIAGSLAEGYEDLYDKNFGIILSIMEKPLDLQQALEQAAPLLISTGRRISRIISTFNIHL